MIFRCLFLLFLPLVAIASVKENVKGFFSTIETDTKFTIKNPRFSIYTGSFVKHIVYIDRPPEGYNEYFNNRSFAFGMTIDEKKRTSIVVGALYNSYKGRCGTIGISRDWKKINDKMDFVGLYAYVGELPGLGFSRNCGNDGSYGTMERITGIGFVPYLYHGVRYNITPYLGVNMGLVFPHVFVSTIEWRI
jgi:hypothetical protein